MLSWQQITLYPIRADSLDTSGLDLIPADLEKTKFEIPPRRINHIMAAPWRSRSLRTVRHLLQFPSPFIRARNTVATTRSYATSDSLPKIADRSVWTSMIPRFIRNRKLRTDKKSKEWNPATFYIVMFTLIGSQAIRMLTLKNSYASYTRSTDAKIKLLQEVIERIKKGEKVDVEKLLGTGDEVQEREWEEGMFNVYK